MKRLFAVCLCLAACLLCACGALEDAAELQEYDLGVDTLVSVNALIGEREVSGYSSFTGSSKGLEIIYKSDTVYDDLVAYVTYLKEDMAYIHTQDMDLKQSPGGTQLARNSEDEGIAIIITIKYTDSDYTLRIEKGKGSVTLN